MIFVGSSQVQPEGFMSKQFSYLKIYSLEHPGTGRFSATAAMIPDDYQTGALCPMEFSVRSFLKSQAGGNSA